MQHLFYILIPEEKQIYLFIIIIIYNIFFKNKLKKDVEIIIFINNV
jgi:hypothetical protein